MTWKRAIADDLYTCGSCNVAIPKGGVYALTRTRLVRCATCAAAIEPQPDVIEEDEATGVPSGVTHQASLGYGGERDRMVRTTELAHRQRHRLARHLTNRQRGAR